MLARFTVARVTKRMGTQIADIQQLNKSYALRLIIAPLTAQPLRGFITIYSPPSNLMQQNKTKAMHQSKQQRSYHQQCMHAAFALSVQNSNGSTTTTLSTWHALNAKLQLNESTQVYKSWRSLLAPVSTTDEKREIRLCPNVSTTSGGVPHDKNQQDAVEKTG